MGKQPTLDRIYCELGKAFGPQHWWPADSAFEMMVGAILTQATSWHNVEYAIAGLKAANLLNPQKMLCMNKQTLEAIIRPVGFYRQKAKRLHTYTAWYLERFDGKTSRMFKTPLHLLRKQLLDLNGIGEETADCILLYAGQQPVFVIDAYTRRMLSRHGQGDEEESYAVWQRRLTGGFNGTVSDYGEFHALIVETGKRFCFKKEPNCNQCPLGKYPHTIEE